MHCQRVGLQPRVKARVAALTMLAGFALQPAEQASASGGIHPIPGVVTHIRDINQDGAGVLVTTGPYGYYQGRLFAADRVTEMLTTPGGENIFATISQDRGSTHHVQCGWVESATLRKGRSQPAARSSCHWDRRSLERDSFGKDFNCPPSKCLGGTAHTQLSRQCDDHAYYNFAPPQTPDTIGSFYDYAGRLAGREVVHYRYTTLDGRAAVVKTARYGWVYIPRSCITGQPRGGPPILALHPSVSMPNSCAGAREAVERRTGVGGIGCSRTDPTSFHCEWVRWANNGRVDVSEVDVTYRHKRFYVGIIGTMTARVRPDPPGLVVAYFAHLLTQVTQWLW
jgi:hypothetical protein